MRTLELRCAMYEVVNILKALNSYAEPLTYVKIVADYILCRDLAYIYNAYFVVIRKAPY